MKSLLSVVLLLSWAWTGVAQTAVQTSDAQDQLPGDISGMYTFLKEGEFVQIDAEEPGKIGGFVSRYGDGESDRGAFLDHLIEKGERKGDEIHFVTKPVHSVWFEFKGRVFTGLTKDPSAEGYRQIKGRLTEYATGENQKTTAQSREVTLKSFPAGALDEPASKKD